jgi:predicted lactoylglutathione lyase
MSVPAQLNIVTLGVADVARARAFYEALGWEAASSSMDEICWMQVAGTWLGLWSRGLLAEDAGLPDGEPGSFGGITLAINLTSTEAVDEAMATALAAGATVTQPAVMVEWGIYRGYFTDLDGHPWEVAWNPGFPVNDDGTIHIP